MNRRIKNLPYIIKNKFDKIRTPFDILKKEIILLFLKKTKKNISNEDMKKLIDNDDLKKTWACLKDNDDEDLFNLILTIKYCTEKLDIYSDFNNIEKKIYKNMSESEIGFTLIKNLKIILENIFNEMIKKDSDIINKPIWTSTNLDSLYLLNFDHIDYSFIDDKKDPILAKKIVNMNIVVTSLERLNGVILYTKLKEKEYPQVLKENINFTKGYLVCFTPELSAQLKNFKYMRKIIKKKPMMIIPKKKKMTLLESFSNYNFSYPIWLNEENINLINLKNYKIYNNKLIKKKSNIELACSSLNFLNSIELTYIKELWDNLIKVIEKNTNIHHTLTTKNKLTSIIYQINTKNDVEEIEINNTTKNLQALLSSASTIDLIEKQLNYYNSFFLDHRMDSRLRIYCYPWPINYQLNHIIRVILKFKNPSDINTITENFFKNKFINKYLQNYDIFEHKKFKDNEDFKKILKNLNYIDNDDNISNLKKEYIFILICKLSENIEKNIEKKIKFTSSILDDFINEDLVVSWEKWTIKLKIKNKKLPYLLSIQNSLKDAKIDKFENIFWGDASSNAIQLITLRLQNFNPKLLMLTNIINNETEYENIYEYITEKIKESDHTEIIKKIKNKLTQEEISFIQEKDLNKYLIMPSSYGMGKFSYREKIEELIIKNNKTETWEKLDIKEKNIITDYFWSLAEKYLKEIDFDLNIYKEHCNSFWKKENFDIFIWKNDIGITLAPISIKTTKRQKLLKELNETKLKIKETNNENKKSKLNTKIKKLEKKLKKDEKNFWKRTMIQSIKNKIFSRIYYPNPIEINSHDIRQSLIPNTIHAYDASIIHFVINLCKKLKIKILVIHDSIGCDPLLAPLVKTIFKIVNIHLLDLSLNKKKFPLNINQTIDKEEKNKLYKKILESKDFFR